MTTRTKLSGATQARIRDYVIAEPSFTIAFAAWELGLSVSAVSMGVKPLIERGAVRQIEPRSGPYGAVYAYAPPAPETVVPRRIPMPELDVAIQPDLAARRGQIVPHTRAEGPSGKPGQDKKRQQRGVRVKRNRQGA